MLMGEVFQPSRGDIGQQCGWDYGEIRYQLLVPASWFFLF